MAPPHPMTSSRPEESLRVAQEYADLFNARPLEDIDRLIADACVDPLWDDRTNLLSLLADGPEDLALVLATDPDDYVVVRFTDEWVVDTTPVDWEELEDQAFDDTDDSDDFGDLDDPEDTDDNDDSGGPEDPVDPYGSAR